MRLCGLKSVEARRVIIAPFVCFSMRGRLGFDQSRANWFSIFAAQHLGENMVSSGEGSFTKQAACPSSTTLLDYRLNRLATELSTLVKWHLEGCDFCWAEVQLLVHHSTYPKGEARPPAIPVNLRVLAEALLQTNSLPRQKKKQPTN